VRYDGDAGGIFPEGYAVRNDKEKDRILGERRVESTLGEDWDDEKCDVGALTLSFFLVIFPICALALLLVSVSLLLLLGAL
jgi:hypothetical protein